MFSYHGLLQKLAKSNSNERMPCTGIDKVKQWYDVVLNNSYSEIRIFCKDLNWLNDLFLLESLGRFVYTPWTSIKILLKEDCDLTWLNHLSDNSNLEIRIAKGSYAGPAAKEFAVADNRCFRFEARPDFGIINFNNSTDSERLIDAFNQAFKLGVIKDVKKVENNNE